MQKVKIYSDGACKGNPDGPGGYGTLLQYVDKENKLHEKEFTAGYKATTNNRMEILAVIKSLEELKEPCEVDVFSDSQYVCNAVNKGWARKWKSNNWMKNSKDRAHNTDLWEKLLSLLEIHNVKFTWIRGHNGDEENERCDRLAVLAIEKNIIK